MIDFTEGELDAIESALVDSLMADDLQPDTAIRALAKVRRALGYKPRRLDEVRAWMSTARYEYRVAGDTAA